jgi:hypothetical protein
MRIYTSIKNSRYDKYSEAGSGNELRKRNWLRECMGKK